MRNSTLSPAGRASALDRGVVLAMLGLSAGLGASGLVAGCEGGHTYDRRADAAVGRTDAQLAPRADAGFGARDGQGAVCASVSVALRRVTPNVTVVVDQSESMNRDLSDGLSRWDATHEVLTGPDGLVTRTAGLVRFGLALYSDTQGGSAECPRITSVPIALENRDAIEATFAASEPLGETPTGDALERLIDEAELDPTGDPRVFVLATDGSPDRCGAPDAHDDTSRSLSVRAVSRAYGLGIRTYVIGVGRGTVASSHLAALAAAGVGHEGAPYYEAGAVSELAEALRTIVRGEISCTLELEGRIAPSAACSGEVLLDGAPIRCDDPDGWRAVDETHIELRGAACDAMTSSDRSTVEATFPCDAILI